jgi:hypothetical protein
METLEGWANLLLARHNWQAVAERVMTGLTMPQTGCAANQPGA